MIRIIDYGSQVTQLIARRVRELGAFSEVVSPKAPLEEILVGEPDAIITSGGQRSVYEEGAPLPDPRLYDRGPVLGVCYGMQAMAKQLGGTVENGKRQYGGAPLDVVTTRSWGGLWRSPASPLFSGMPRTQEVWMSHGDTVMQPPAGFTVTAYSDGNIAAMENPQRRLYAVQFHPEVSHTTFGSIMLSNFLRLVSAKEDWQPTDFIAEEMQRVRERVGKAHVVGGVSGGVDSSTLALFLSQAIGEQFHPIFVDNGLLRKGEVEEVSNMLRSAGITNLKVVDAGPRFLAQLRGVTDPEEKRMRIGRAFIEVFTEAAERHHGVLFLAQGTTYPDVIESKEIKSHHNVGGLPERIDLELIEPLRMMFKDEVRGVGEKLGLPHDMVWRHPFPGPGLAVRIVGEVTPERVRLLQEVDAIYIDELRKRGLYGQISQAGACLPGVQTVGVMGDAGTYLEQAQLRAVVTDDFMTARPFRFRWDDLEAISQRIVNEVRGVNRVVYDVTQKPPGTIELE